MAEVEAGRTVDTVPPGVVPSSSPEVVLNAVNLSTTSKGIMYAILYQ